MDLKKWKIFSIFAIFGISALLHFIYVWFPCYFTTLFFPVNESIWEHNKIIIGSFLIWAIIEKIFLKKQHNIIFSEFIGSVLCAFIVMSVFTPIFFLILKTKDNMIVTFIVFFLAILISQFVSYKIMNKSLNNNLDNFAIYMFVWIIILNINLTYFPLKTGIFFDYNKKIFGIP